MQSSALFVGRDSPYQLFLLYAEAKRNFPMQESLKDRIALLAQIETKVTVLREKLLEILDGGLWHTTSEERYQSIIRSGAILPNPDIPDSERWKTSQGEKYHPYVRILGGVSLFDFNNFDPHEYSEICPSSSWREFVPYRTNWGSAVWIEIDRDKIQDRIIPPDALWDRCVRENCLQHTVMPFLEAGYIGKILVQFFRRVLQVNEDGVEEIFKPQC